MVRHLKTVIFNISLKTFWETSFLYKQNKDAIQQNFPKYQNKTQDTVIHREQIYIQNYVYVYHN